MSHPPSVIERSFALALFALAVAAVAASDFAWAQAKALPAAPAAAKSWEVSLLPDFVIPGSPESRTETVDRTLFNPTRRPAPAASPAGQEVARPRIQRGQFTLTGTTVAPEGKNTAFLREVNGGKSRRVSEGDTINGLRVAEVKPDRVKLTMGDEQEELYLKVLANPRPTPAAAAPPVAQAAPAAAAPAAGRAAPAPAPAAGSPAPQGVSPAQQSLIERRRAARAAALAEQGRTEGSGDQRMRANPQGSSGPPAWGDVFRSYQQRGGAGGASQ